MNAVVDIDDLSFAYEAGQTRALDDVAFSVAPGEAVALLGPSGAGKTTLLALLDGRVRGWQGHVKVLGHALEPDRSPPQSRRADIGFIFQEFALVERSSVLRNVLNGRLGRMSTISALLGRYSEHDIAIAGQTLADCGIADLADRRVDSLSGGQRQRVAIARCLAQEPRLILADEPVSHLDPTRTDEILSLITESAQARGATTVFVTHQPNLAVRFASRIVGISEGRIAFDTPSNGTSDFDFTELYRGEVQEPHPAAASPVIQ